MTRKNMLVVCTTCRRAGADPLTSSDGMRLSEALAARGVPHDRQECLSACGRSCVVVFRGPGSWTYVQGDIDPDRHLDDIAGMARAYAAAPRGVVPWSARPQVIRKHTIARIPPFED